MWSLGQLITNSTKGVRSREGKAERAENRPLRKSPTDHTEFSPASPSDTIPSITG